MLPISAGVEPILMIWCLTAFSTLFTLFDIITAHAPISAQSSDFVVFRIQPMYLYLFLQDKSRQFKWVPTTYAFIKMIRNEYRVSIINNSLMKFSANLSLKCALVRCILYWKVFPIILKNLSAQCGWIRSNTVSHIALFTKTCYEYSLEDTNSMAMRTHIYVLVKKSYYTFTRKYGFQEHITLVERKRCDNGSHGTISPGHVGDIAFLHEQKTHIATFGALGCLALDTAYDIK